MYSKKNEARELNTERYAKPKISKIEVDPAHIEIVQTRIEEYKVAAVLAKKDGNVEVAKEHLRIYKSLQETLEKMENGYKVGKKPNQ